MVLETPRSLRHCSPGPTPARHRGFDNVPAGGFPTAPLPPAPLVKLRCSEWWFLIILFGFCSSLCRSLLASDVTDVCRGSGLWWSVTSARAGGADPSGEPWGRARCASAAGAMLQVNPEERLSIAEVVHQLQEIAAARNVNPKSPITEVREAHVSAKSPAEGREAHVSPKSPTEGREAHVNPKSPITEGREAHVSPQSPHRREGGTREPDVSYYRGEGGTWLCCFVQTLHPGGPCPPQCGATGS